MADTLGRVHEAQTFVVLIDGQRVEESSCGRAQAHVLSRGLAKNGNVGVGFGEATAKSPCSY
jgi:hypothetical protein